MNEQIKWKVHSWGDSWCAHLEPRGRPSYVFEKWSDAYAFSVLSSGLKLLEDKIEWER